MSASTVIPESSTVRAVPLCHRRDLTVARHIYRGQGWWIVKDPLAMEFYQLNDEEYAILGWLDGQRSLSDIRHAFEDRFSPQRISEREIQYFILDLYKKSLLLSSSPEQGQHLIAEAKERRRKKLKAKLSNPLAIRWRGIDPDRLLDRITPWFGWMGSVPAVAMFLAGMVAALLWLLIHQDEFYARIPALDDFLGEGNWLLLLSVVVVTKIIHEFAHAISFKRLGGECHEIGVMFLFFMPTLYCNTTDAWLLPNKWQRAAVGLAGIYIELILASIATFGWWFTNPGTLNYLCLDVMFASSLSAIVLNGNPLMRYDGYYVFSDLCELPNLQKRSGKIIHDLFMTYVLGIPRDSEPDTNVRTKALIVGYRVSSTIYILGVLGGVFLILVEALRPYGLEQLAVLLSAFSFASILLPPLISIYSSLQSVGSSQHVKTTHTIPWTFAGLICLFVALCLPLPAYVNCSFTIEPRDARTVFLTHAATLTSIQATPGERVATGAHLALFRNVDVELELNDLQTKIRSLRLEVDLLELSRHSNAKSGAKFAELSQVLRTTEKRFAELSKIRTSLQLTAPCDGYVIPEWTAQAKTTESNDLAVWHGSALERENLGVPFSAGQPICRVGDLRQVEALLLIDQSDIGLVTEGQSAKLLLDSKSTQTMSGKVRSIARHDTNKLPASLSRKHGGSVEARAADELSSASNPSLKPASPSYQARVPLDDLPQPWNSGLRGKARIYIGLQTMATSMIRGFYKTFRSRL